MIYRAFVGILSFFPLSISSHQHAASPRTIHTLVVEYEVTHGVRHVYGAYRPYKEDVSRIQPTTVHLMILLSIILYAQVADIPINIVLKPVYFLQVTVLTMSSSSPPNSTYRSIRASYTPTTITIYQAYSPAIANSALSSGRLTASPLFKCSRMTWIKPSFLWMAHRSGWASKTGQERVLAIEITREGFEWALQNACLSSHDASHNHRQGSSPINQRGGRGNTGKGTNSTREAWEERKNSTSIRVQWDPERDLLGRKLEYRSLQIGLGAGEPVDTYVGDWTVRITDVTGLMKRIAELVKQGRVEEAQGLIPVEEEYPLPSYVTEVIGASKTDVTA